MNPSIKFIEPPKGNPYWYGVYFTTHNGKPIFIDFLYMLSVAPMERTVPPPDVVTTINQYIQVELSKLGIGAFESFPEQTKCVRVSSKRPRMWNLLGSRKIGNDQATKLILHLQHARQQREALQQQEFARIWEGLRKNIDPKKNT